MSTNLTLPVFPSIKSKLETVAAYQYRLEIEPLIPGYGNTFGNTIRRILLSSIPGFGVTAVRINDLTHEFQPIEGVKEDAIDVVLNLKSLRCRIITSDQKTSLTLKVSKAGKIYAKDFVKDSRVEISNPDLYICESDGSADLEIEVDIERGIGYRNIDDMEAAEAVNPLDILVDTHFSPVTNVSLVIDKTRVADKTNFDKIIVDFTTDGTLEPEIIVNYAFDLIIDIYQKISSSFEVSSIQPVLKSEISASALVSNSSTEDTAVPLSETTLSKRLIQILKKNDVVSVSSLKGFVTQEKINEVFEFAGMSEKYVNELKEFLSLNSKE